ncbi:hypothetical protein GCM10019016_117550 [Streptomyces prasinosporus]|uniref:Gas vesicle protein K n=1 Tax=Streptomyces prasinosporus TaxID=68256 RepID=A0ABP6UDE0_9ACTN
MTAPQEDRSAEPDAGAHAAPRVEPYLTPRTEPHDGRRRRLDLEPDTVERDLIKLVLTVVELLRQLMERQALRRFDEGDLTEEQEERVGLTLMLLEDRMAELRDRYGLRPEDLNLDLGPLGPLLPRD